MQVIWHHLTTKDALPTIFVNKKLTRGEADSATGDHVGSGGT